MNIIIQSPHQKISGRIDRIIREKFMRLEKMYDRIEQSNIVLKKEKNDRQEICSLDARLSVPGNDLFATDRAESFSTAADKVCSNLERQIRKLKTKLSNRVSGSVK